MIGNFLKYFFYVLAIFSLSNTNVVPAHPTLSVSSTNIIQGEPLEIVVQNASSSEVKSISFNGKKLGMFFYQNQPTAFVGVDINQKPEI